MALRLGSPADPAWHDLGLMGARLQLRPYDAAHETAGLHATVQAMREHKEGTDGPNVEIATLVAIARAAVVAWDGVTEADGTPAPCDARRLEQLIRYTPGAAMAFRVVWRRHTALLSAEGNASAPSPNGISARAAAAPTAETAATSAPDVLIGSPDGILRPGSIDEVEAPGPSAPITPVAPDPSRASPSGDWS